MKKQAWKVYAFWIALPELLGAAVGFLTRGGMKRYAAEAAKPPLTPPGIAFMLVWALLYALMGAGMARIRLRGGPEARRDAALSFFVQLFFNLAWSVIFFTLRSWGPAFVWLAVLWLLALRMTLSFAAADRTAALLQIPYLLWILFAGYLNYGVWMLNR